jgi:hypothetical protein
MSVPTPNPADSSLPAQGPITGNQLRRYRTEQGIRQADLATEFGVTSRTIVSWESLGDQEIPMRSVRSFRGRQDTRPASPEQNIHRSTAKKLLRGEAMDLTEDQTPLAIAQYLQGIGHAILSLQPSEVER